MTAYDQDEVDRLASQARVLGEEEVGALEACGLPSEGEALEVGCGPGAYAAFLQERWPGLRVHGVELLDTPEVVGPARRNLGGRLHIHDATLDEPLPGGGGFELVYARLSLRHMASPGDVIRRMREAACPGGRVILMDADDNALRIHPRVLEFEAAVRDAHALRREEGELQGIGPLLAVLAAKAGLRVTCVRALVLTTNEIQTAGFRQLMEPFLKREHNGFSEQRNQALVEMMDAWATTAGAFAGWTMYFVGTTAPG